jgi:hypothetical protein
VSPGRTNPALDGPVEHHHGELAIEGERGPRVGGEEEDLGEDRTGRVRIGIHGRAAELLECLREKGRGGVREEGGPSRALHHVAELVVDVGVVVTDEGVGVGGTDEELVLEGEELRAGERHSERARASSRASGPAWCLPRERAEAYDGPHGAS